MVDSEGWSNLSGYSLNKSQTKSCPTTPHGSVPDLLDNFSTDGAESVNNHVAKPSRREKQATTNSKKVPSNSSMGTTTSSSSTASVTSANNLLHYHGNERGGSANAQLLPPAIPRRRRPSTATSKLLASGDPFADNLAAPVHSNDFKETPL